LPPPQPRPTRSVAAHTRYLEARLAARRLDSVSVALAADRYAEAIALDSTFADAWAGLAELALRRALAGADAPTDDGLRGAAASAERALALDSMVASAHVVLGAVRYLREWSWDSAAASLRRALAINPNLPRALAWDARLLLTLRQADTALARMRAASALDPLDPALQAEAGRLYLLAGELGPAEVELRRAWLADSSASDVALAFGLLAEIQGDTALAAARVRRALAGDSTDPRVLAALARAAALGRRDDEARAVLVRLDSLAPVRRVSPYDLATVAVALNDRRRAFAWLDAALAARAPELVDLALDPRLAPLRGDRRFARIARAVGLPPGEGGDYVAADSTPARSDRP
jgi:Tfp pilus assembly protein PilF